ncbi:MAG TPA: hypothetical protein VII43_07900 [Opitutaceae bacterium]
MNPPRPKSPFFGSADARLTARLCLAALLLAALALNMRVLDFGFLYLRDDDVNITLNPHMGGLDAARLHWMFTDWSYVRRYIPLGWLNFSATYEFAGLNPAPYHGVALALYVLNCGLVFSLLLGCLRRFAPAGRADGVTQWEAVAAALGAGWWALHPLRVETTAWVSGNLYGQALALLLASLLAYLQTYSSGGRRRAAWLALAALAYCASLLTYPVALGAPVLLVGLDWLHSRATPGPSFRRLLAEKSVFLIPLAAVLALTVGARFANTEVFGAVPGMRELPLASRIAQSAYVAAYYVWKPWWPVHLSPLYDTLVDFRPTDWPFVLSMAAVAAVSAAAIASFRRRPAIAVVWFGYLAAAAPFFGLTEKPHMASDRYSCFLMVIMAAVLAAALARIRSTRARALASVCALAILCVLGRMTWGQLGAWSDDLVQHAYVVRGLTNPELLDDFTSRQLILEFLRGYEEPAAQAVAAGLRANPSGQGFLKAAAIIADKKRISAYYGPVSYLSILQDRLALRFAKEGQYREANDHFGDALRLDERFYQAAYDRSLVLLRLGKCEEALRNFFLSDRWDPSGLATDQRREFLTRLQQEASATGKPRLADAARSALAR